MLSDERKKIGYKQVITGLLRYFLLEDRMLNWRDFGYHLQCWFLYIFLLLGVGHLLLI